MRSMSLAAAITFLVGAAIILGQLYFMAYGYGLAVAP